jgi:hypothetical protein
VFSLVEAARQQYYASAGPPTTGTALFRTPLASDSARGGETLDHVRARRGTIALSLQVIDLVTRQRRPSPEATLELIEAFFDVGDAMDQQLLDGRGSIGRPAPRPAILNDKTGPRPAPAFVEWLMSLREGWVTDPCLGLTDAQQLTALGNGVAPAQAFAAVRVLARRP